MATEWRSREVELRLPKATLEAMWVRARRSYDLAEGGRYDARSRTTMLLWSGLLTNPGAEPIGAFSVKWDDRADQAAIRLISWTRAGSEAQVWHAIKVLAGREWPTRLARRRPVGRGHHDEGRAAA
jgi:hypothetical protein